jgi:hypothetical protein
MAKYLISVPSAAMVVPKGELPARSWQVVPWAAIAWRWRCGMNSPSKLAQSDSEQAGGPPCLKPH